jgi:hypothetical protein
MKKTFVIFAAFCIMSMGACFSPWDGSGDQGAIVINLGDGGARGANGDGYTVILTGLDGTSIKRDITGGRAFFSVQPGPWNIAVRRTDSNDRLKSFGKTDVEVIAGATVTASISMDNVTEEVRSWPELIQVFKNNSESNSGENQIVLIIENLFANSPLSLGTKRWNITLLTERDIIITNESVTDNCLFRVLDGCELTLGGTGRGNITISGGDGDRHSLILVQGRNSKLNMYDGIKLTSNRTNITSPRRGGGVTVEEGGTFNMHGGIISGNSSNYGGGVRVLSGTFNKTGGTIYGYTEDDRNSNMSTIGDRNGHAVYYDTSKKYIDKTLWPKDNL